MPPETINIKSINPDDLILLLQKIGLKGDVEGMIVNDCKAGFTLDETGNVNVLEYLAWLIINTARVRNE